MKKYFFILSLLCLGLVSCENNEPEIEPVKDPLDYTLVHMLTYNREEITSISIFDSNGNSTGYGTHIGSYYVPKTGSITINWTYDTHEYYETFYVGSAQELWIYVRYDYAEVVNEHLDTY